MNAGWWFGTFFFPFHMGCHPSHWRTHIFQDGYCTRVWKSEPTVGIWQNIGNDMQPWSFFNRACLHYIIHHEINWGIFPTQLVDDLTRVSSWRKSFGFMELWPCFFLSHEILIWGLESSMINSNVDFFTQQKHEDLINCIVIPGLVNVYSLRHRKWPLK